MNNYIPYYSPQLEFIQTIRAIMTKNAVYRCIAYYQRYTGKKYILLTNSCRTALYLAYKTQYCDASVLVSPLICKAALLPIVQSGNHIIFADIDEKTWNIDASRLPEVLPSNVKAMQITYFGGVPDGIKECVMYARKHRLTIIEDTAQGFGGDGVGTIGDIVCLSMIKTAYGISGGVFATNDEELYKKAKDILFNYPTTSVFKCFYRLLRNCLDTKRYKSTYIQRVYDWMLSKRPQKMRKSNELQLGGINSLEVKIVVYQQERLEQLHKKRKKVALSIVHGLNADFCKSNFAGNGLPMKLYVEKYHIKAKIYIDYLRSIGIEAMHLQQKYDSGYQDSLSDEIWLQAGAINELIIFKKVHDTVVSVPLLENMAQSDMERIINELNKTY